MKTCTIKMIISFLFIFLCNINSSSQYSCDTINCPRSSNSSVYSTEVSVHSPFRLKSMQEKHCGYEGFDLYCDDTFGTLIQFPNDVVLHVDEIYYYSNLLILSDPYDHSLIQKLFSFDLADTHFHPANDSILIYYETFWFYNCSIYDYYDNFNYDIIDCLSGSRYTVISTKFDTTGVSYVNPCTFLKILTVPALGSSPSSRSSRFCTVPKIALTWSGVHQEVPPTYSRSKSNPYFILGIFTALMVAVIPFAAILCCYCRFSRNVQATTSTMNNHQSRALGTTICAVTGLDQVTIDSYPVVVVGASGRVIKPHDTTCPICLSDYGPHETLKILPECIHRFHADCIDQWLRTKGVCPICGTSTPYTPSNH